ncbi:MAG: hypothetical protein ACYCVY_13320 [Acidiferrobacteraceae bacterium]
MTTCLENPCRGKNNIKRLALSCSITGYQDGLPVVGADSPKMRWRIKPGGRLCIVDSLEAKRQAHAVAEGQN